MSKNDDYSITLGRANGISLLLLIPLTGCIMLPYVMVWGWAKTSADLLLFYDHYFLFLLLVVAGIVAHELLHGLTWMMKGEMPHHAVKFGFNWRALAPYAHCKEPVEVNAYRWGTAMPGIVLGVLPFLVGLVTGNGWFSLFGYLFIVTASGDILILWLIRNIDSGIYVQDHPEKAGCKIVASSISRDTRRG